MKAIVLWEPWASAMALGLKQNETRHWSTNYRGELAICSARRPMTPGEFGIAESVLPKPTIEAPWPTYGCVLCVVDLQYCVPTCGRVLPRLLNKLTDAEYALGDYTLGRFAWVTRNLRRLTTPVPVTGRQGLFNLPPEVEAAVRKQLL